MQRCVLPVVLAASFTALLDNSAPAQAPSGWIQSDLWACLVPLQGNDCTGGGVHSMLANWVAPHDLSLESPKEGDVWDDIDFGGAAESVAWRGAGDPTWLNIGLGPDPNVVDWNAYLIGAGLTFDYVLGAAVTYVNNTTGAPLPVGICTASDDAVVVMVNSTVVTALSICRGTAADCAEINPAVLAPGVNRITVLVWDGFGGFGFRLALLRPDFKKFTSADAEIEFLGAAGAQTPPPAAAARAARRYPGAERLAPRESFPISVAGSGFQNETMYTVVEEITGVDFDSWSIADISHGGRIETIEQPRYPGLDRFETREFIGTDIGGGSNTAVDESGTPGDVSDDVYTSTSTSGGDLWGNGDDFEFIYSEVSGDFDVAIEFLDKSGGNGRWGKFGLIARESLDRCARNTFVKDHLSVFVDITDCAGLEGRGEHLNCPGGLYGTDQFEGVAGLGSELCHPRFLRLTRRGSNLQGWASNAPGLADGTLNPSDDLNWTPSRRLGGFSWSDPMPEELYVGFFNSEHNDQGWAEQTIRFRVLRPGAGPLAPFGRRIVWSVPGSVLNGAGVGYRLDAPRLASLRVQGRAGPVSSSGPAQLFFQAAGSGPIGEFDDAIDIGRAGPCVAGSLTEEGAGAYRMTASGLDVWATGDQFHFAYREVTGDFVAQARFGDYIFPAAGGRWGKTGLMARWDATPNSAYYYVHNAGATNGDCDIDGPRDAFRPKSGFDGGNGEPGELWWQDVFGEERIDETICFTPFPYLRNNDLRGDERNLAPWLRLVRRGESFSSYASDDGVTWKAISSFGWIDAPDTLLVGVAMTSHANCETQTVSFDSFSIDAPDDPVLETPPNASLADLRALPGATIFETDFEDGDDNEAPPGWVTHKWGGPLLTGFNPQAVAGRFRLGEIQRGVFGDGIDTGTSAFWPQPIDPDGAYLFDFDVFFSYDMARTGTTNPPADGITFTLLGTDGAVKRQDHGPIEDIDESFLRTTVGTSRGANNDTDVDGDGLYTTVCSTARDHWADGDSFEFAYKVVEGDFDIAVEIAGKRFPPGGRWGKFGLMARQSLAHNAKFGMVQDHGPDLQDAARFARRVGHRKVWEMEEPAVAFGLNFADPNDRTSLAHPRYLRLTRRGNVISGWLSNTAGDTDPANDRNWRKLYDDNSWAGVSRVYLGFSYSVHNSSNNSTGEIDWRLLVFDGNELAPAGGGEIPGEAPIPHALDARFGERGGGMGYHRINQTHHAGEGVVRTKDLSFNSFAIEFDNWHNGEDLNDGDGGNVSGWNVAGGAAGTGSGGYHVNLDVNGSIYSAQRNNQLGVHDNDLPDIYDPDGVHVSVLYDHGRVKAWVRSVFEGGDDDSRSVLVVDADIEPLALNAPEALFGFTSGTGGASTTMEVDNLAVKRFGEPPGTPFKRGDANADGGVNIADASFVLNFLFLGGREPPCVVAADSNGDGNVNIADASFTLNFLFLGGREPPAPHPDCGRVEGEVNCAEYPPCR
jgi:hypothetical protein